MTQQSRCSSFHHTTVNRQPDNDGCQYPRTKNTRTTRRMAKRSFTLISRSAQSIISHLALFKSKNITPASRKSLLFALSTNVASSDLGQLVDSLTTTCASTIGCLSAPTHASDLISCSVALFDHDECVPFRSEIPGTEIPQVGRWHSFRMKDEQEHPEELQWEDVWGKGKNKARSLPDALQPLEYVLNILSLQTLNSSLSPLDVSSLLYFTDASPQGLIHSLSSGFPNARRVSSQRYSCSKAYIPKAWSHWLFHPFRDWTAVHSVPQ